MQARAGSNSWGGAFLACFTLVLQLELLNLWVLCGVHMASLYWDSSRCHSQSNPAIRLKLLAGLRRLSCHWCYCPLLSLDKTSRRLRVMLGDLAITIHLFPIHTLTLEVHSINLKQNKILKILEERSNPKKDNFIVFYNLYFALRCVLAAPRKETPLAQKQWGVTMRGSTDDLEPIKSITSSLILLCVLWMAFTIIIKTTPKNNPTNGTRSDRSA
jgi:hypothetical protein